MSSIVFDVETKKDFRDVGSRKRADELGISVVGAYDFSKNAYLTFEEHELASFEELLRSSELIIGFNIHGFDFPVLQPYFSRLNLSKVHSVDILADIAKHTGYRVSLNSVARATLNSQKSGDGLLAIELYRAGKMDELKRYCLDDVRLTKEIYEFGVAHEHVLISSKDGLQTHKVPVAWTLRAPVGSHQKLF